jgi:hypothetical protein
MFQELCLILGYRYSEDCDFYNMIYKNISRGERSVKVRVSHRLVSFVKVNIVREV